MQNRRLQLLLKIGCWKLSQDSEINPSKFTFWFRPKQNFRHDTKIDECQWGIIVFTLQQ